MKNYLFFKIQFQLVAYYQQNKISKIVDYYYEFNKYNVKYVCKV